MKPEPTFAEKLAGIDTLTELEGVKMGLEIDAKTHGREVDPDHLHLLATRRYEIQRERGAR